MKYITSKIKRDYTKLNLKKRPPVGVGGGEGGTLTTNISSSLREPKTINNQVYYNHNIVQVE